jgi:predicted nucleotidyltransferase
MRTSPILDALFPEVRAKLLAATFTQPWREWYLTEIAAFLGTRPSSLQREVDALAKAGILTQRREGKRTYLKADASSPVFPELQSFFDKTAGMLTILSRMVSTDNSIEIAFVFGSVARSAEISASDIDLMIVGGGGLAPLIPSLREAERLLGRPINPTIYSLVEFKTKYANEDHFLKSVLAGEKNFVKGDGNELDKLLGQG